MSTIKREYYRVPREDRMCVIIPPPGDLPEVLAENRAFFSACGCRLGGRPLAEFRAAARAEVLAAARSYTAGWGFDVPAWLEPAPVIVTGHQTPPFHPGVWLKNFLAGRLAVSSGGVALNLTVDNDEARGQAVRFPAWDGQPDGREVHLVQVELAAGGGLPLEEQPASSLRPEAIHEILAHVPPQCAAPVRRFWVHLVAAMPRAVTLAGAFAAARRSLEEDLGLRNLELPVSVMSDTRAFREFCADIIIRHEAVVDAYNGSLAEYRRAYRERSAAQPVPDLAREAGRVELPLWVWREGGPRRRLWLRSASEGGLLLEADHEPLGVACGAGECSVAGMADRLASLRSDGWKIRPRALALTLFVRMAVADLFIHGLGGALYDKVTDAMIERLLGVSPPRLAMASCTVHLPLEKFAATREDLADARRAVRRWRFSPDRMLDDGVLNRPEVRALIDEKRRLIRDRQPEAGGRRRAYHRAHEINEAIAAFEPDGPRRARDRLGQVRDELRANAILAGREYAFAFYDAEDLAAFYAACAGQHDL